MQCFAVGTVDTRQGAWHGLRPVPCCICHMGFCRLMCAWSCLPTPPLPPFPPVRSSAAQVGNNPAGGEGLIPAARAQSSAAVLTSRVGARQELLSPSKAKPGAKVRGALCGAAEEGSACRNCLPAYLCVC